MKLSEYLIRPLNFLDLYYQLKSCCRKGISSYLLFEVEGINYKLKFNPSVSHLGRISLEGGQVFKFDPCGGEKSKQCIFIEPIKNINWENDSFKIKSDIESLKVKMYVLRN